MLKLLHTLFPRLHRHLPQKTLALQDGVITPVRVEVCACGDRRPLCQPVDHVPPLYTYDHTAGLVETPLGPGKYVAYEPDTTTVIVEQEYRHLVRYPAGDCYISPEG